MIARARVATVATLFSMRARIHPARVAIEEGDRRVTYGELADRVSRLANVLASRGVTRGSRVAIVSENRAEYLETFLACARLGAIACCPSFRLTTEEIAYCIDLVEPAAVLVSPRHREKVARTTMVLGEEYDDAPAHPIVDVDPEDPLLILYTSGTTGLPKGAVLSHRAEIVRNLVLRAEFGIAP